KGDRLQRKNCFADTVHRFDLLLKACRGRGHAKPPVGVYHHCRSSNGCRAGPNEASHERFDVGSGCAEADDTRVPATTQRANSNVIIARCETAASVAANVDVVTTGVGPERLMTHGRVVATVNVLLERASTRGRVIAGRVVKERASTRGRVSIAKTVAGER